MFIEGTINNFVLTKFDDEKSLDSLPKPNTGVRFKYLPVSTKDTAMEGNNTIYVEGDVLHFDQNHEFDTFSIYNLSGQLMRTGVHEMKLTSVTWPAECMCCSKIQNFQSKQGFC